MSLIPDLQYRGKEVIKGHEFAASKNFKVNKKNSRAIEETAQKMDFIHYDQIHMLTEKKKAVSRELKKLSTEQFNNALKFEEEGSMYKSLKNVDSRKHVESFSIMLSGCHNRGISVFEEKKIPVVFKQVMGGYECEFKVNWVDCFPSVAEMQNNHDVPKSLLESCFSKKRSNLEVSKSCSSSTATSSMGSRTTCDTNKARYSDYKNETLDLSSEDGENRRNTSSFSDHNTSPLDEYKTMYNGGSEGINGHTRIMLGVDESITLNFDMALTTMIPRKLAGPLGTHNWKVYTDIKTLDGVIPRGDFVRVIAVKNNNTIYFARSDTDEGTNKCAIKTYNCPSKYFYVDEEIFLTPEDIA